MQSKIVKRLVKEGLIKNLEYESINIKRDLFEYLYLNYENSEFKRLLVLSMGLMVLSEIQKSKKIYGYSDFLADYFNTPRAKIQECIDILCSAGFVVRDCPRDKGKYAKRYIDVSGI